MKDRIARYPGRVKLTPILGQANTYDMERADEPEEVGTPINKKSLLTDETVTEIGLEPSKNPTPDDVLRHVAKYTAVKPGDFRETVRAGIGDRWLLCNGDVVSESEYPELNKVLPYNTSWRRFAQLQGEYGTVRPLNVQGKWLLFNAPDRFEQYYDSGKTAVLYDEDSDAYTAIACPDIDTATDSCIFGLTHDGASYILGVCENRSGSSARRVHLFASTDLVNWSECYQFSLGTDYGNVVDINCDGTDIIVLSSQYDEEASEYFTNVYEIPLSMEEHSIRASFEFEANGEPMLNVYPRGYWALMSKETVYTQIYMPGSTQVAISRGNTGGFSAIAFLNDRYWVDAPINGDETTTAISIYDVENSTSTSIRYGGEEVAGDNSISPSLVGMEYDKNNNTWLFYFRWIQAAPNKYYIGQISADKDPSVIGNYTFTRVDSLPENIPHGQMNNGRTYFREETRYKRYLKNPNIKCLPLYDGNTFKYIYTGGIA